MKSRNVCSRAFSLVELLIAFFVLLVGILAVLVLFPLGLRESKTMVDASMASFAARKARNLMEVQPFTYNGGNRTGMGTASLIQARYGPKHRDINWNVLWTESSFPVMFPWDVLGTNDDPTFPLAQRPPSDPNDPNSARERVLDADKSQYSWDARFTIGGGPGLTPPPGFSFPTRQLWIWQYYDWYSQYFKYYAVQISVYRNYEQLRMPDGSTIGMQGTLWLRAAKQSNGNDYDTNDPNRPFYSELVLGAQPPRDLTVDSYIRVRDDKSDWYKVTAIGYQTSQWTLRLDRPYAPFVDRIGSQLSYSESKVDIIATNSLIESFTTLLGSQLDDINTSSVTYP